MKYVYRLFVPDPKPGMIGNKEGVNGVFAHPDWRVILEISDYNNAITFEEDGGYRDQQVIIIKPKKMLTDNKDLAPYKVNNWRLDEGEVFVIEGKEIARFWVTGELWRPNSLYDFGLWLAEHGDESLIKEIHQKTQYKGGSWVRRERLKRGLEVAPE